MWKQQVEKHPGRQDEVGFSGQSFRTEEDIKSSGDKQKLREFMTTKLVLQEILKGTFGAERKDRESMKSKQRNKQEINIHKSSKK